MIYWETMKNWPKRTRNVPARESQKGFIYVLFPEKESVTLKYSNRCIEDPIFREQYLQTVGTIKYGKRRNLEEELTLAQNMTTMDLAACLGILPEDTMFLKRYFYIRIGKNKYSTLR